jgi:hypothetical protein
MILGKRTSWQLRDKSKVRLRKRTLQRQEKTRDVYAAYV